MSGGQRRDRRQPANHRLPRTNSFQISGPDRLRFPPFSVSVQTSRSSFAFCVGPAERKREREGEIPHLGRRHAVWQMIIVIQFYMKDFFFFFIFTMVYYYYIPFSIVSLLLLLLLLLFSLSSSLPVSLLSSFGCCRTVCYTSISTMSP